MLRSRDLEHGRPAAAPEAADIAIVGAGAAGLTAAIFAAAEGANVVALDGAPKIGAKILISGGGRCNVTHDVVTPDDFFGTRNAIAKVLRTFPVSATVDWFRAMGVELKREETGKLFPTTDRARTVVEAMLRACRAEIRTGARVESIDPALVPTTFPTRGNLGPASVPFTLAGQQDTLVDGDRVLLMGIGSGLNASCLEIAW